MTLIAIRSSTWVVYLNQTQCLKRPSFYLFCYFFSSVCVCFFSVTLNLPLNGPAIGCIVGQREFLGYLRLPRFVPPLFPPRPLVDRGIWTVVHCGFSLVSSGWTRLISENLIAFLLGNCCPVFRFGFFRILFFAVIQLFVKCSLSSLANGPQCFCINFYRGLTYLII